MSDGLFDETSAAAIAQAAEARVLGLLRQVLAAAQVARDANATVAGLQLRIAQDLAAVGFAHRWTDTVIQVRNPDGSYGEAVDLQGPEGPAGPPSTFIIGAVGYGDAPSAAISPDPTATHGYIIDLTLPRGLQGTVGPASTVPGPTGPPPVLTLGAVGTGSPGSQAVASLTQTGQGAYTLTLTIPSGQTGATGNGAGNVNPSGSTPSGYIAVFANGSGTAIASGGPLGNAANRNVGTGAGTVAAGDDSRILNAASQAYVAAAIQAIVGMAPADLDTLKEIADRLASDESTAAALASTVAGKLAKSANLSDLADPAAARGNLGLGAIALLSSLAISNVSGLSDALTAKGSAADVAAGAQAALDAEFFGPFFGAR